MVAPAVGQPHNSSSNLILVSEGTSSCSFPFPQASSPFQNIAHLFSFSPSSSSLPVETLAGAPSISSGQWLRDNCNSPLPPPRPLAPVLGAPPPPQYSGSFRRRVKPAQLASVRWPSSVRSSVAISLDYITIPRIDSRLDRHCSHGANLPSHSHQPPASGLQPRYAL